MPAQVDQSQEEQAARAVLNAIMATVNDSLNGAEDEAVARILLSLTMQSEGRQSQGEQEVRAIVNALWVIVDVSLNAQYFAGVACVLVMKLCSYASLGAEYQDFVANHGGIEAAEAASQHFSFDRGVQAAHEELMALLSQCL